MSRRPPSRVVSDPGITSYVDMLRPAMQHMRRSRVAVNLGVQLDGPPHIGTLLQLAIAFQLAKDARATFGVDSLVRLCVLDNTAHEFKVDETSSSLYQRSYYHTYGRSGVLREVEEQYSRILEHQADIAGVEWELLLYSDLQASAKFRSEFISVMRQLPAIAPVLAPSDGNLHLRVPCPACGWSQKRSERTEVSWRSDAAAEIRAFCPEHGAYAGEVTSRPGVYLDLPTLLRNVVKERGMAATEVELPVMLKGSDWMHGAQLVDYSHHRLGWWPCAPRVFGPLVLDGTGAKLSKSHGGQDASGYCERGGSSGWILDADELADLAMFVCSSPARFFRSYTVRQIQRMVAGRSATNA